MVDILRMGREDLIYKDAHVWLFVCARAVGNLAPCQPLKRVPWGCYVCAVCMYTCHCAQCALTDESPHAMMRLALHCQTYCAHLGSITVMHYYSKHYFFLCKYVYSFIK